jgi:CHAT domain-containing protein
MKLPQNLIRLHLLLLFGLFFLSSFDILSKKKKRKLLESNTEQLVNYQLEIASQYYQISEFKKSNTAARKGLNLLGGKGYALQQFQLFNFLAANYTQLFKDDSSVYYYHEANEILLQNPNLVKDNREFVISYWLNQGAYFRTKYNYKLALISFNKGLSICNSDKFRMQKILLLEHLTDVYDASNQLEESFKIYILLENLDIPLSKEKIYFLSSKGWNEFKRKKFSEANKTFKLVLKNYFELQKLDKKVNFEDESIAKLYYQIGLTFAFMNEVEQSNKWIERGIDIYENQQKNKGIYLARCYEQKSKNFSSLGKTDEAILWLQKGLMATVFDFNETDIFKNPSLSQTILGENTLFRLLAYKGKLFKQVYQNNHQLKYLESSAKIYRLAILLAENYRQGIETQDDKLIFTQNNTDLFDDAINTVYEWYAKSPNLENATAFMNILESNKAVAYNDFIKKDLLKIPINLSSLIQQESILSNTNAHLKQLLLEKNVNVDSLKNLLQANEIIMSNNQGKLARFLPKINLGQSNDFSIKELVSELPKNTSFISYNLSKQNRLFIFVINKDRWQIKRIDLPKYSIQQNIKQLLPKLQNNPAFMDYTGKSEALNLYNILIKPIEKEIESSDRLIICRDGILNLLPFEVLEDGSEKESYLLKKCAITYTFSGIDYLLKQQQSINFKHKTLNILPFLNDYVLPDGDTIKAIKNTVKIKKSNDWLLGKQANKNTWLTQLSQYNQLNFVTHSTRDINDPTNAHLYFYPDDVSKSYRLGFYEILALPLQNKQLVIIASCNSANGVLQEHEASISLTYAFMRAGSSAVIGASWQAHNRASIMITESFQQYLDTGLPKDVALQKAKLDFMKSNKSLDLNHPFYWANLSLTGSNRALSPTKSSLFWYIWFSVILVSLIIFIKNHLPKIFATKV